MVVIGKLLIKDLIQKNIKKGKLRVYTSMIDPYKNIIDEKIENNNIPSIGVYLLLKTKYNYQGKYGIVNRMFQVKNKISKLI